MFYMRMNVQEFEWFEIFKLAWLIPQMAGMVHRMLAWISMCGGFPVQHFFCMSNKKCNQYADDSRLYNFTILNDSQPQSPHRVATAAFWRTFPQDGKICPGCTVRVGGARPPPFTLFIIMYNVAVYRRLQLRGAHTLTLFHLYLYVACNQDDLHCPPTIHGICMTYTG
jgi:hypothetical protein